MTGPIDRAALRQQAAAMEQRLLESGAAAAADAATFLIALRDAREYDWALRIAELVSRVAPDDHRSRRIYGQAMIETGKPSAAIDLLEALRARLDPNHAEAIEASGVIGRAWKDIFLAAHDQHDPMAVAALGNAFDAYRKPFARDPKANSWQAVNVLALSAAAARLGIPLRNDIDRKAAAEELLSALAAVPAERQDAWHWATVAEAAIALEKWDLVAMAVRSVAEVDGTQFQLASVLRQLSQLWGLDEGDEGRALLSAIRARLLEQPGGLVEGTVEMIRKEAASAYGSETSFEALIGLRGPETYRWWHNGLKSARAVASVRRRFGQRLGTAWLATADMFGLGGADEQIVVTNYHVVNPTGEAGGLRPGDAEVVFEAVAADAAYAIKGIVWHSAADLHDISILKLTRRVVNVEPLAAAPALPVVDETARVYVVGYPGGRDLAFSFQDNQLIDHEGPDDGKPQIPGVCRIHYLAPTEGGSSGSPVFNASYWEVIGVHHRGGRMGMPMLNGKPGSYAANEAVSIRSIAEAVARSKNDEASN